MIRQLTRFLIVAVGMAIVTLTTQSQAQSKKPTPSLRRAQM